MPKMLNHQLYYSLVSRVHQALGSTVAYCSRSTLELAQFNVMNIELNDTYFSEGPLSPKDIAAVQEILCP